MSRSHRAAIDTSNRPDFVAERAFHTRIVPENVSTVKPLELMRWLVRLVTPPGGRVLDPFAGSGTTLLAAEAEGREAVGIEQDAKHCAIIRARLSPAGTLFAEPERASA